MPAVVGAGAGGLTKLTNMKVEIRNQDIVVGGGTVKSLLQLADGSAIFAFVNKGVTYGEAAKLIDACISDLPHAVVDKNKRDAEAYMQKARKSNYKNVEPIQ